MKKILLLIVAVAMFGTLSAQQKCGYIYSKKVFDAIPAYKTAVTQLENYVETGKKEVKDRLAKVKEMYDEYNQYQSQMSTSQRDRYKKMIIDEEDKVNKYEEEQFGENGTIAKMQQSLLKPIEDNVEKAVQRVAQRLGYDMVFDLSLVKTTIYQSPSADLTNQVIQEMAALNVAVSK